MDKAFINLKELRQLLGTGVKDTREIMEHLLEVAKEKNYYIPDNKRCILIPTSLVYKELKLKKDKNA